MNCKHTDGFCLTCERAHQRSERDELFRVPKDRKTILKEKLQANDYAYGETRQKLRDFSELSQARHDFHEPDEQGITAVLKGKKLDNAFGDCDLGTVPREKVIELRIDGEPICRVNLANLLALAAWPSEEL